MTATPDYGNWVSARLVVVLGVISVLVACLGFLYWPLGLLTLPFFIVCLYFAYARYSFSSRGGNLQARIEALVLDHLVWDGAGRVLDIGCGNGPLTIALAKTFPRAQVTGIDLWGAGWEYAQSVCEQNAQAEAVAERVTFRRASAASLPFEDGVFDAAVSNLVFHEVQGVAERTVLLEEALRVVKKGGPFAFQDLFLWKRAYGDIEAVLATLRSSGLASVELIRTCDVPFIPRALRLPFMVGTMAVICGTK
ncbi:MAG: class I SAM-dependent methyltransferase [Chloroflexi bacterium]|nr:class I SAM-dependent methyltransferase [Chloroflexota bacterium]